MDTVEIEVQLWAYIDGLTTPQEAGAIETLIRENEAWRAMYQNILGVHQSLDLIELEQPSLRFSKNVMEQLAHLHIAPAAKTYIDRKIIWGILAFFVLSMAGFLIYGLGQINWTVGSATPNPINIDLPQLDFSRAFNSTVMNVFIMINAVLGLMLLDRYLTSKRTKRHHPSA